MRSMLLNIGVVSEQVNKLQMQLATSDDFNRHFYVQKIVGLGKRPFRDKILLFMIFVSIANKICYSQSFECKLCVAVQFNSYVPKHDRVLHLVASRHYQLLKFLIFRTFTKKFCLDNSWKNPVN